MLQSMTGYGVGEQAFSQGTIQVAIKTLNSKVLDLSGMHVPSRYGELEQSTRAILTEKLRHGKVDMSVSLHWFAGSIPVTVALNQPRLQQYRKGIESMFPSYQVEEHLDSLLPTLLNMPEVWLVQEQPVSEEEEVAFEQALHKALEGVGQFRVTEGAATAKDLLHSLQMIEQHMHAVEELKETRVEAIRARLMEGLRHLQQSTGIETDPARFNQELVYYIEKYDINEELKRLAQHCRFFREQLDNNAQAGKRLNFIAQEMGREINTLGSKANHEGIQHLVVEMKDYLERIKEQSLNVL